MSKPMDLLIFSDCVVDINYMVPSRSIKPSNLYLSSFMGITPGGLCNTAIAAVKVGLKVMIMDKLGNDPLSTYILDILRRSGINVGGVRVTEGYTTMSINLVLPGGSHVFIGHVGVNSSLSPQDIDESLVTSAKVMIINGFCAAEGSIRDAAVYAVEMARGSSTMVFLDLGPMLGEYGDFLKRIGVVDVVLANEHEAAALCRGSIAEMAECLGKLGKVAFLKLGRRGSVLYSGGRLHWCRGFRPRRVVSSVGSGDVYDAVVAAGIVRGLDLEKVCLLANAMASLRLEYPTVVDMPPLGSLRDRLERLGLWDDFKGLIVR